MRLTNHLHLVSRLGISGTVHPFPPLDFTVCIRTNLHFPYSDKGKGKDHPITGHEGPEGKQMYSSTLPSTSALDVGGWSTPRPGRFTPGKDPVPIVQEAGWAPRPVRTGAENLATQRDSIPGPSNP